MKFSCFLVLLLFLAPWVNGQELYGKFLDHEQGLLSQECYDINHDEKGYLIVGTQYGPMKYDGEKFIPICTNLPLERRVMYDFEKAPDGTVYLLNSINELFRLQNDSAILIKPKNQSQFKPPFNKFVKLSFKPGKLYILGGYYVVRYSFKTNTIERYYQHWKNGSIYTYNSRDEFPFKIYYKKNYLINYTLVEFPESNQKFKMNLEFDTRESVTKIGDKSYILISMRLFKKKGNHVKLLDYKGIFFCEYFHNRIWLCTMNGLLELDKEGNLIHHHFKGLIVAGVTPLKSGGIAVSFNQKGVFITSDISNRIHYDFTATTVKTIESLNLVGNLKGEIYKYRDNKLSKVSQTSILKTEVNRSYRDQIVELFPYKQWILCCSGSGITTFTTSFEKVKELNDKKNAIFGLFHYKDHFYLFTRQRIIKTTWKDLNSSSYPYNYSSRIALNYFRSYALLNDSVVLIGTNDGLFRYYLNNDKLVRVILPAKDPAVTSVSMINPKKILVSTRYKGIYLRAGNKILKKISSPCVSIAKALFFHGQLIVQGNDGIYIKKLNKSGNREWIKFFSGETTTMFILQKSLLISYKDDLVIKKLSDSYSIHKPKILLNECELAGIKTKRFPTTIPANTPLSIDIDILQFDANKLDLYYKLKGENTITQLIEGTKINFDALKSGKYQLKIYPVIDKQIQFNNSKTFHFTIEKTFWESTIFYIGSAILFLLLIFSVFITLKLRRKKRSAERSELESKMNEYKLLAVKAQVNPHFLSNGLAAIQALILKEDNELAAQYLAKFSYLMRKILLYSEQQFISISDELLLVDAYLELELLRFRHKFSVQKNIHLKNDELVNFIIPSLLLQPILENAIWHGLKDQEDNPALNILFEINEKNELVIEIRDNGHGFREKVPGKKHFSKGNQLIQERINTLNKQFETPVASLEILSSENGTIVRFVFSPKLYNVQA